MNSKEISKLQDGDKLEFVFGDLDDDSGEPFTFEFGGFTVSGPITVEEVSLFDATFYYAFNHWKTGKSVKTPVSTIHDKKNTLHARGEILARFVVIITKSVK